MRANNRVEVDGKTDFSAFKTFAIQKGQATSRRPELTNELTLKTIEAAIRSTLSSKGLKDTQDCPDLIVSFSLAEVPQRGTIGEGRNVQPVQLSVGTLVIDLTNRETNSLIWHGIYSDEESNAAKLAQKLPNDARKLLSKYSAKRKK